MALAILIIIAIIFYLSIWTTMAYYFVRMQKLTDVDKKLKLSDKTIILIFIEQAVAFLAVIVFYAVRLKGIEISVDDAISVSFAVLFAIGFVAVILLDRFYMRKHFPEYGKRIETEQDQRISIHGRDTFKCVLSLCMINFMFNLMLFGAMAHLYL